MVRWETYNAAHGEGVGVGGWCARGDLKACLSSILYPIAKPLARVWRQSLMSELSRTSFVRYPRGSRGL
jgi:hypothetical protein